MTLCSRLSERSCQRRRFLVVPITGTSTSFTPPGLYAGYAPVVFPGIVDGIRPTVGYNDHPTNITVRTLTGQQQTDIAATCIINAANILLNNSAPPTPPVDPCGLVPIDYPACILSLIDDANIAAHLTAVTSYPTLAGTNGSYAAAQYVKAQFESYGLSTVMQRYDVLLAYPISTYVAQVDGGWRCHP